MNYFIRHQFNGLLVKAYHVNDFALIWEEDKAAVAMLDAAVQDEHTTVEIEGVGIRQSFLFEGTKNPFYYLEKR